MQMSPLQVARLAAFATLLLFSLIVLGIGANFTNISGSAESVLTFEGLSVAVAVLTFLTVIPVLVIDFFRRGAVTSFVVSELAWGFVLMILWIAAAADASSASLFPDGCGVGTVKGQSNCHQYQALQAFAWLNFVILFGWLITLAASAAMTHANGNTGIWTSSVPDAQFFTKGFSSSQPATHSVSGYPPQLHSGTQQAYPISQQQPYHGSQVYQGSTPYNNTPQV